MVTETPHLNNEAAERIEGEITLNEASVALRNMKHYKSPCTGGFSEKIFQFIWGAKIRYVSNKYETERGQSAH